jgi:hypothetical protein
VNEGWGAAIEEKWRAAVGHGESPGALTLIEGWGVAMEESGMCVPFAAGSLQSGECSF